ncbi:hypothetical protein LXJ59_29350, partial [Escherichia coli]|nr:hypothetical protein [Escherichia coli]
EGVEPCAFWFAETPGEHVMDQFPGLLPRPSYDRLDHRNRRQQQSPTSHLVDDYAGKPRGLDDGLRDRHGESDQRVEIRATENEMTEAP